MYDDQDFWNANVAIMRDGFKCANENAKIMVEFAESTDDPIAWMGIIARMDDFISRGVTPPFPFVKGMHDAMNRWRKGEKLDYIFGVSKVSRGNQKANLNERAWQRTNAMLMSHWIAEGFSEDKAAGKVAELRAAHTGESESVSTIKRHYKKQSDNK